MVFRSPMFSGIVESVQPVISIVKGQQNHRIRIARPDFFTDIKLGDSIACNGICLTVEELAESYLQFSIAAETLRVLSLTDSPSDQFELHQPINLERSLKYGDRIHGHLVTGHVESLGTVTKSYADGESWMMSVRYPISLRASIWPKGSVCLHGVSLTVNQVQSVDDSFDELSVCLIPETQVRTQLTKISMGKEINIETDYFAKSVAKAMEQQLLHNPAFKGKI